MASSLNRRIFAVGSAACTVGAAFAAAPVAEALPAGNYVAFGDSFAANPGQKDPTVVGNGGCPQSVSNIGNQVARQTGLELRDFSCNGSYVYLREDKGVNAQVDNALAQGAINDETQLVTFFMGANDTIQNFLAPKEQQDKLFNQKMTEAIRKVQARAPMARIMVIGYPEITSSDDSHYGCFVNLNGFAPQLDFPRIHKFEMDLQERQIRAANETNVGFVNMKDIVNIDSAMCAADGQRNIAALLDSDGASYNMPIHPTFKGSEVYGTTIADVYKSTF